MICCAKTFSETDLVVFEEIFIFYYLSIYFYLASNLVNNLLMQLLSVIPLWLSGLSSSPVLWRGVIIPIDHSFG